jgi:hypothetical protein
MPQRQNVTRSRRPPAARQNLSAPPPRGGPPGRSAGRSLNPGKIPGILPHGRALSPPPPSGGSASVTCSPRASPAEVTTVHWRYAAGGRREERVPSVSLMDTGFGRFCVMLDPEPDDVDGRLRRSACALGHPPSCTRAPCCRRRRSRNSRRLGGAEAIVSDPPVMATFHPAPPARWIEPFASWVCAGDARPIPFCAAHPFEGLHAGGFMFASGAAGSRGDHHRRRA